MIIPEMEMAVSSIDRFWMLSIYEAYSVCFLFLARFRDYLLEVFHDL
jgi:hypothetical protein